MKYWLVNQSAFSAGVVSSWAAYSTPSSSSRPQPSLNTIFQSIPETWTGSKPQTRWLLGQPAPTISSKGLTVLPLLAFISSIASRQAPPPQERRQMGLCTHVCQDGCAASGCMTRCAVITGQSQPALVTNRTYTQPPVRQLISHTLGRVAAQWQGR